MNLPMPSDLRTRAVVLRRTNYGESDRILNFLTPTGKVSVLARGVRKEKSRLAGGIELFTVSDVVIHQGRGSLGTLTSAKMLNFYHNIIADVSCLELAATFLKKIDRAAEQITSPEHFSLLSQSLDGLNRGLDAELVHTWFLLNLRRIGGEELNLIYDINGAKLVPEERYIWDNSEQGFKTYSSGDISSREIKFLRFLLSNSLLLATKVENYQYFLPQITSIAAQLS